MRSARPACAIEPKRFGRRGLSAAIEDHAPAGLSNDLRLFAATFAGGFLFVSILIF